MKNTHEGRLAYAKAAQNHNLVVSPYLYPETFRYMDTKSSIAIDGLSDASLQDLQQDIQGPYDIHPRYREMRQFKEYYAIEARHHSKIGAFSAACFAAVAGVSTFVPKAMSASKSDLPPNAENAINILNVCKDSALKQVESEVSAIITWQEAQANLDGIIVSYKKPSAEFSRAIESCIATKLQEPQVKKPLDMPDMLYHGGSIFGMAIFGAMALAYTEKAIKFSRKSKDFSEKEQIVEGDAKILKAEIEKRGLSIG